MHHFFFVRSLRKPIPFQRTIHTKSSSIYLSFHLSGITSNVELYSSHIVCRTLSYNTKDRRPRLDSYNSFHDQPDDNQTRVYVVFVNPSADTGLPFLSRILSQSISCPQGHSFEGILMDMLLQRRQTKRIKYAISIQKKKINTNGNYAICLIYLCTTGSYLTDFKKQNCLTSHQKKS